MDLSPSRFLSFFFSFFFLWINPDPPPPRPPARIYRSSKSVFFHFPSIVLPSLQWPSGCFFRERGLHSLVHRNGEVHPRDGFWLGCPFYVVLGFPYPTSRRDHVYFIVFLNHVGGIPSSHVSRSGANTLVFFRHLQGQWRIFYRGRFSCERACYQSSFSKEWSFLQTIPPE